MGQEHHNTELSEKKGWMDSLIIGYRYWKLLRVTALIKRFAEN